MNKELERLIKDSRESQETKELLLKLYRTRNRDILRETVMEYERKGEFVRIYPAKGGEIYEQYFQH